MSANYRIVGDDGKQYGPVTGEQVRQWIAQGRAESRTPVFVEGAKDWTFVGLLPEFADCFPTTPAPPTIAPPVHARRTSGFATAGMVCGILSWTSFCCCCTGVPFSLLALVFSLMGLSQINRHPELYEGRGQAIAGLVLAILYLALTAGYLILSMATGNLEVNGVKF